MLLKTARKVAVAVIGGTVLLLGVIMLVAPGPGIVGILAGLAILATEFAVAAKLLKSIKNRIADAGARVGLASKPDVDPGKDRIAGPPGAPEPSPAPHGGRVPARKPE